MTQGFLWSVLPEGPKVKAQAKSVSQGTLCPRLSSSGASPVGTREPAPLDRGLMNSLGQPSLNLFTEAGLLAARGLRQTLSSCYRCPVPALCLAGLPGAGCGQPRPCHRGVASSELPGKSSGPLRRPWLPALSGTWPLLEEENPPPAQRFLLVQLWSVEGGTSWWPAPQSSRAWTVAGTGASFSTGYLLPSGQPAPGAQHLNHPGFDAAGLLPAFVTWSRFVSLGLFLPSFYVKTGCLP